MANESVKNKQGSGLSQLSPVRRTGWGILFGLLSLITLIAIIDYDPSNYHSFPPDGSSPLLGQAGIILGRFAFAYLGLSSWFLPWCFGVCAWLFLVPSHKEQKMQKLVPLPFIVVSVSLMANLRDYTNIQEENSPIFEQSTFEHGAGVHWDHGYIQECHFVERLKM